MNITDIVRIAAAVAAVAAALSAPSGPVRAEEPVRKLKVCATIPDLGDLAREVGGDEVEVTVFTRGPQDPHFVEAKPSFIKSLASADALVIVGLDLEVGWAPVLWRQARNGAVLPGAAGFIEASRAVTPLDLPAGIIDRALGDVHPQGNPHYLTDPINGLRVARLLTERFQALRPSSSERFSRRFEDFARRLGTCLVGARLAGKYDVEKLCALAEAGKLAEFLGRQGDAPAEGWIGRLAQARDARVAADHNVWSYVAHRFGFRVVGLLEPKPGIPPTPRHLAGLMDRIKAEGVRTILTVPYFDPRHAQLVAERTGARVSPLAHQCGAAPGTDRYLDFVEYNVKQLEAALAVKS